MAEENLNGLSIQDKIKCYVSINKELYEYRKKQKEQKKKLLSLEEDIHNHMTENDITSLKVNTDDTNGEIVIYEQKVSQTFKKEAMIECLKNKLKGNEKVAEELTESILTNKVFNVKPKIKCNIKK